MEKVRTSQPAAMMANEISAAAIECGAKTEKIKRPAVAACWPKRDHRSPFGAWKKVVGGFAPVLNRLITCQSDLQFEKRFSERQATIGGLIFLLISQVQKEKIGSAH